MLSYNEYPRFHINSDIRIISVKCTDLHERQIKTYDDRLHA